MQEMWETGDRSLGWEDPLEEEMATHSSILAWEIPGTEEPGGFQFMGSQRAGHNWAHRHRAGWIKAWNLAPALWLNKYLSWSSSRSWPSSPSSNPLGACKFLWNGCQCQTSEPPRPASAGKACFQGTQSKRWTFWPCWGLGAISYCFVLAEKIRNVGGWLCWRENKMLLSWYGHRVWRHLVFHISGNIKVMRSYVMFNHWHT